MENKAKVEIGITYSSSNINFHPISWGPDINNHSVRSVNDMEIITINENLRNTRWNMLLIQIHWTNVIASNKQFLSISIIENPQSMLIIFDPDGRHFQHIGYIKILVTKRKKASAPSSLNINCGLAIFVRATLTAACSMLDAFFLLRRPKPI